MVAIYVKELIKKFGDRTAVSIPDFCFPPNEIIGLVGNNGAGKTTLFRLILNLIRSDKGMIDFCIIKQKITENYETHLSNLEDSWKDFTGAYLDESFLIDFLTPEEYFAFIIKANKLDNKTLSEQLQDYQTFLGEEITDQNKFIREFSAGNKQKIGIVSALIAKPKVVILDEPFNFLDPSSQNQLKQLLTSYKRKEQATILISSHNLHHTIDISDRIVLLENGRLIENISSINVGTISDLENYFM